MKLTIAQLDPTIGSGIEEILPAIEKAKLERSQLVIFPELALVGYPPKDLLEEPSFIEKMESDRRLLERASLGIHVICGYVERNPRAEGRPYLNAAGHFFNGKLVQYYGKQLLPYYDVFDEPRYFEPDNRPYLFLIGKTRVALSICEDLWNEAGYLSRPHALRPVNDLKDLAPDLVINIAASPFSLGKPQKRLTLFSQIARGLNCSVLVCNQVGGNDDLIFDGCSFCLDPRGNLERVLPAFEPKVDTFDWGGTGEATNSWPDSEGAWLTNALILGIRDYVRKCGFKKVCLGLSGGIDSAVSAALAVEALGHEAVLGVGLPSRFNSKASRERARDLATRLEISYREMSIDPCMETFSKGWTEIEKSPLEGIILENVQPRIRMLFLMAIANHENRLLLNTSNKSEIATGYATLYGDTAGAISVLGDLTKRQIYEVARFINRKREIISKDTIQSPPSAELREGQLDEHSLPPYSHLDPMVEAFVEHKEGVESLSKKFPRDFVRLFLKLHDQSEYKRSQMPPVLRVSHRAFGSGRRIPIAAHRQLELGIDS